MKHLNNFNLFESKNYGDVYHSILGGDNKHSINTALGILEKGIRFSDNYGPWKIKKHWAFLGEGNFKTISVTRDSTTKDNNIVTFVLDGNAISNNYRIEPCNLGAPREIKSTNIAKDRKKNMLPVDTKWGTFNGRYMSEEKILSKKDNLETKYIKEIILNTYSPIGRGITEEDINIIKENANGIKVTVINTSGMEKLKRQNKWINNETNL